MKSKTFPALYKKEQVWNISVTHTNKNESRIETVYGKINGKQQTATEIVTKGVNIGKANERSVNEHAEDLALSYWEKKAKKGYSESGEGVNEEYVTGGVAPMLAQNYKKHGHKIVYPCLVQPKLDGRRCLCIVENGKCTLWSRTRKPITSCPHIQDFFEKHFKENIIFDGELYNHDLKNDFEKIISASSTKEPNEEAMRLIQYHVYDIVDSGGFLERFEKYDGRLGNGIVKQVMTKHAYDEDDVKEYFSQFVEMGYEGLMIRNALGEYKIDGRSYDLQKYKEFDDAEFEIVDIISGKGKMDGKAIFVCKTKENKEFNAKMKGSLVGLEKIFNNKSKYIGCDLTVRYQGFTNDNIPRFPVGIIVRDYE